MGMDETVQVSVYCLAYNHEKYIRKTLEGFAGQKTNFRFKVIIHEDASTDSTAQIIREYEEKYPHIFDVIYQKENQYSKRVNFFAQYILPRSEGKYITFCEGDDYWCDEYRLQKQFDIMEANPDLVCSFHRVGLITEAGDSMGQTYPGMALESGFLTSEQFVDVVCSDFFQLSSLFCRRDAHMNYMDNFPPYTLLSDVGDLPQFLYLGSVSERVYFFDEVMSHYRCASTGSVTLAIAQNAERQKRHHQRMLAMIDSFDECTQGRYRESCDRFRERQTFETCAKLKDIGTILKSPAFRRRFRRLPLRAQASIAVKGCLQAIRNKRSGK